MSSRGRGDGRRPPTRLVLLGHPLGHSLSAIFQNAALRHAGLDVRYEPLETPPERLDAALDSLIAERAGGNVTVPHKAAVARRCARLSPLAERTGAVNTFLVEDAGLVGDNTDVAGFEALVRELLGEIPGDARIALIGAGGAAAAVLAAVERWEGARAVVWNRNPARARNLAARFPGTARVVEVMDEALSDATLVVNATPAGQGASSAHPAPLDRIDRSAAVLDLVYRRGGTEWIRAARERGHRAADGLAMLIEQGARSFEIWTGLRPDRAVMRRSLDEAG